MPEAPSPPADDANYAAGIASLAETEDQPSDRASDGDDCQAALPSSPLEPAALNAYSEMLREKGAGSRACRLAALVAIRRMLAVESPPSERVMAAVPDPMPPLVELLDCDDDTELQVEAVWIVSNLLVGDVSCVMRNPGIASKLVRLLSSQTEEVRQSAILAIGNIAGDGPAYRDLISGEGAVEALCRLGESSPPQRTLREVAWALSQTVRHKKKQPAVKHARQAVEALVRLSADTDVEVAAGSFWGLAAAVRWPCFVQDVTAGVDVPALVDSLRSEMDPQLFVAVLSLLQGLAVHVSQEDLPRGLLEKMNGIMQGPDTPLPALKLCGVFFRKILKVHPGLLFNTDLLPAMIRGAGHALPQARAEFVKVLVVLLENGDVSRCIEAGLADVMMSALQESPPGKAAANALRGVDAIISAGDAIPPDDFENHWKAMLVERGIMHRIYELQGCPDATVAAFAIRTNVRHFTDHETW
eukprot:TRINITY_DN35845_c0_g1_i1.p1 TRINITY_DN35845_c0_g1~~TRINITY_DN35845_c0_g1_i1.p1  ORF type:complete len:472 (+),score=114.23 TRINITY_DN35845_c0_g1_i1:176-1591(+)